MDILQNLVVQCLLSQHGNVKMQSFSPPCPNIAMSQSSNLLSCVGTWQCHNPVCIPDVPCPNTTISQSNYPVSQHIYFPPSSMETCSTPDHCQSIYSYWSLIWIRTTGTPHYLLYYTVHTMYSVYIYIWGTKSLCSLRLHSFLLLRWGWGPRILK